MRRRSLYLLLAAALALAVFAAGEVWRGDREVSAPPPGERALPGLADKLATLDFMRLRRGDVTVNFRQSEHGWVVVEKGGYPADQTRLRQLLLQLAELQLVEPKTDRPELLSRLDLDDPANGNSTLVTIGDRNGTAAGQIIIGRARPSDIEGGQAGVYVRKPDSEQAWLARGSFELGGDALSWLDRRILDIAPGRVASVVLTMPDGNSVTLARGSADLPLAIDGLPADAKPKPDEALAAPAGALEALDLADVKPASEQPLSETGVTTAAFTTFDGLVVGLRLSSPEKEDWLAIDVTGYGKGEAAAQALSTRLSPWRFAIPPERARLLRTTLSDLLLPHGS
ncbi:MAG TPA: DUF4340 domain-containing protein [Stellaceae bacterium]|jgi:hypothetical protein|nr:DUF4340 domain-containing protein [Stellaceae bacterium]